MKTSKRILSVVLALSLVLSVFAISAFAYTKGADKTGDDDVNFKYEVAKVASCSMADASGTYTGDDIYAVTMYAKAKYAISVVQMPIYYNKLHYSPVTIIDGADIYVADDTYYDTMSDGTIYVYAPGDYVNNTGMYKADGTAAASKALAKCIGLGNANAAALTYTVSVVCPGDPTFTSWSSGIDTTTTGIAFYKVYDGAKVKNAYLNTVEGVANSTDWVKMGTVYFQRISGVTDADCVGDVFGVITDDAYGVFATLDKYGKGYLDSTTNTITKNADVNIVSNATVAAAGATVANVAEKVRWTDGVKNSTMDIGLTATVTGVGTLVAGPQTDITEIGFKYSTTSSDYETIKAGSNKVTSNNLYNTSTAGTYTFRAIIGGTDTTSTTAINAVAYVVYKGETYYAPDVTSVVPATVVTRLLPS